MRELAHDDISTLSAEDLNAPCFNTRNKQGNRLLFAIVLANLLIGEALAATNNVENACFTHQTILDTGTSQTWAHPKHKH